MTSDEKIELLKEALKDYRDKKLSEFSLIVVLDIILHESRELTEEEMNFALTLAKKET